LRNIPHQISPALNSAAIRLQNIALHSKPSPLVQSSSPDAVDELQAREAVQLLLLVQLPSSSAIQADWYFGPAHQFPTHALHCRSGRYLPVDQRATHQGRSDRGVNPARKAVLAANWAAFAFHHQEAAASGGKTMDKTIAAAGIRGDGGTAEQSQRFAVLTNHCQRVKHLTLGR